MGRKLGLIGRYLRDAGKKAQRAASAERARERREEAKEARALERLQIRMEREAERERVADARARERARVAEEREDERRRKAESKEAQLEEWRLEAEEYNEVDRVLLEIANEGPEIEEREDLYRGLSVRQAYLSDEFVPPRPIQPNLEEVGAYMDHALAEIGKRAEALVPDLLYLRTHWNACAGLGALCAFAAISGPKLGILTATGPFIGLFFAFGAATVVIGGMQDRRNLQIRNDFKLRETAKCQEEADKMIAAARISAEQATGRSHEAAKREHSERSRQAAEAFNSEEDRRLEELRGLLDGEVKSIGKWLDEILPIDVAMPTTCSYSIENSRLVSLDIGIAEPSVLQPSEAKILASGKISYKSKTASRLREEYARVVAGLAMRYASEVLFNIPTCNFVQVRLWRTAVDPSTGLNSRILALDVVYDFATLAPMRMETIDPYAALTHFKHTLTLD